MRQLRLGSAMKRVLERIRERNLAATVFGLGHEAALELYRRELLRVLNDAGLPLVQYLEGRELGLELLRLLRSRRGAALGRELELLVRKWRNLGLDQEELERVILGVLGRMLTGAGHDPVRLSEKGSCPRHRNERTPAPRTYLDVLRQGAVRRNIAVSAGEQAARHRSAIERNRVVSGIVRDILRERGVPGRDFIRYNAFAYRVDRLARYRGGKSRERTIADFVDRYEARGLDPGVLRAIARAVPAS